MDRHEGGLRGDDPGGKRSKKRVSISTNEDRPQKAEWTRVLGDMQHLEDIPALRRGEDEGVKVVRPVWAQDGKHGVILPLMWENSDAMAYAQLGSKYLNARRFRALPNHGRVHRNLYGKRACATVYRAWRMGQEA